MKVYFYFSVYEELFARVAGTLRDEFGFATFGGFVWGHDQRAFLEATNVHWARIDVFTDWLARLRNWKVDYAYLEKAEVKYGVPNLNLIVYSDRFLAKGSYERVLSILEICLREFERMVEEYKPDVVVFESVDSIATNVLHIVASKAGIPCFLTEPSRIPGRTAFFQDRYQEWRGLAKTCREMQARGLTTDERAHAEEFLLEFQTRQPQASQLLPWMSPVPKWMDFSLFGDAFNRFLQDPRNPNLVGPLQLLARRVTRQIRHYGSEWLRYFEQPVPDEKFVLFPLHLQPEVSTLVMAPFYVDQIALIEDIAKSLPIGYRLYVKEHFVMLGRRPLEDYRRIRDLYNVRLISPHSDSFKLVKQARAVTTITSTMGWEAILFEKPVISFGEPFYSAYPQVVRASRIAKKELPALFQKVLTDYQPDHELLLQFIAAVLQVTVGKVIMIDHARNYPQVLSRDNTRNIAELIAGLLTEENNRLCNP